MPESIPEIIRAAARTYGLDPDGLVAMASIESGLNPQAKNPHSSAGGLFQFIDATAKAYGLADRFDPVQAVDAGARFARDNAKYLATKLGRPATPGEVYLAHQQGAAGAVRLLIHPDVPARSVVSEAAITLNGGTLTMTAGQFAALWTAKLDRVLAGLRRR